jgi:tripartite-type tricarboxylate transporter receptor subunit TctC
MLPLFPLVLLFAAVAGASRADWLPSRTVKLVVPFARRPADVVARALAEPLSRASANRSSSRTARRGGNIAAEVVARSTPDGHTLLVGTNGPLAVSPALESALRMT